jgi:cytochrome c peroxidase
VRPKVAGDHALERIVGRRVATVDTKWHKGRQPSGDDAATALGHRLFLDPGLDEDVGRHRCGRGRGREDLHRFW